MPTLEVRINGKGPFRIGFDTGARGGAHISSALAQALNLAPAGEGLVVDPSGRNPLPIKFYKLDSFDIGGLSINGLLASGGAAEDVRLRDLDGVIGLGAFRGFVVSLDYENARFRAARRALPAADGASTFAYSADIPELPLTIEGRTVSADLDTGNTHFPIVVPEAFAKGLKGWSSAHEIGEARTIGGNVKMSATGVSGPVVAGVVRLDASQVGWPSIIDRANVGSPALSHLLVELDPANKRIRLRRTDNTLAGR
jgi:hypothetical protein